jgi:two-component system, NarL family, sensor histidine kinase EvgS
MPRPAVLVADGDEDTRRILETLLRHWRLEPVLVTDGEAALAAARERRPALVICELYLPCAGEPCLVRALKRSADLADVPVLAYTASAMPEDELWVRMATGDAFLAKPAEPPVLRSEVSRLAGIPA